MHGGSSARFPTKPTEKLKIEKMYAIKQIKICAEYRDMLLRPRLDLSGTPGLRPIGLSPGSWQTSLGLGSMSRYSAQILICITYFCTCQDSTTVAPCTKYSCDHCIRMEVRVKVKRCFRRIWITMDKNFSAVLWIIPISCHPWWRTESPESFLGCPNYFDLSLKEFFLFSH